MTPSTRYHLHPTSALLTSLQDTGKSNSTPRARRRPRSQQALDYTTSMSCHLGSSTFQRIMERVLHGLHWSTCLVYLDDCIILGKTFEQHMVNLEEVLQRFRDAGFKLKPSKCQFFRKEVTYLGHVISPRGVLPNPANTMKVSSWPRPTNPTEVRSFLGLASFYRRFILDFAQISSPLTDLTHKGRQFVWTDDCEEAFNSLKQALTSPPLLAYPDFGNKFFLATDASQDAVGAVLSQMEDGKDRVVAYYSQKLTATQRKWSTYDRKLWAIVSSVRHFRHYLRGQEFTILNDHQPLLSYGKAPIQDDSSGRRARWIVELSAYTFTITHRKGSSHQNADALSRLPDRTPQAAGMVTTRSSARKSSTQQPERESTNLQSSETTASKAPENFIHMDYFSLISCIYVARPEHTFTSPASDRVHQSVGIGPMRTWDSSIRSK